MLSIARTRLAIPVRTTFLLLNAFGLLVGTFYNDATPDLYPNNSHHKLGWAVTWIVSIQAVLDIVRTLARRTKSSPRPDSIPRSFGSAFPQALHQGLPSDAGLKGAPLPFADDSGHGTARNSMSVRSGSYASDEDGSDSRLLHEEKDQEPERYGRPSLPWNIPLISQILSRRRSLRVHTRLFLAINVLDETINRISLVFGFVAFATGVVTFGGIFRGSSVFNGLAHFIKGGIFFWYGLLTLGRWMGCFGDFGWAWNIRPSKALVGARRAAVPSAEFVESSVIFLYGITNVFLEHLAAWGSAWSAQDLEHVSITIMFFAGGLCGMLVESTRIRDLLNAAMNAMATRSPGLLEAHPSDQWASPRSYRSSMNPLPGLIIVLLGLMMSSHHQDSMTSTMIHAQWGMLLVGFGLARAVTYVMLYIAPPSSIFPSRPPSELIASSCLISGGLIFMASNRDTVAAMERHGVEAMFVFTVTMGLTAFIMAWTMVVVAVKGWATRRRGLRRGAVSLAH
ncbi:MAG: hypothetical protein M1817_004201 [Caeruleum heppii]|nr:MAG: hypothetical protein M1817_004201 [Caeruleum heppii]